MPRQTSVPEPMASLLAAHCNVEALDLIPDLREYLQRPGNTEAPLFRRQLAHAILNSTIKPREYERLTNQDFDSQQELDTWLRQLWSGLFDDAPVVIE